MDTREAAELLGADPSASAMIVDFDGTLSDIAPTPEEARVAPGAREALEALAARLALVAVVTGRLAADVEGRVEARGVRYLGLYGLDDGAAHEGVGTPAPGLLAEVRNAAAAVPGAIVESKGPNVAVHFRLASDPSGAERHLSAALGDLAGRHGLRVLPGKRVLELAPAGAPTKGESVRRLIEEAGVTVCAYAGDDVADLEAFSALDDLCGAGALTSAIKIAVRSGETPTVVRSAADLVLAGPRKLVDLLDAVAGP